MSTPLHTCARLVAPVLTLLAMLGLAPHGLAQSSQQLARFGPHEDSYVLLANRMSNNGWSVRDEQAMRGRFSFKYTILGEHYVRRSAKPAADTRALADDSWELFVSYTGEFDFYAGTRDSGPVVNRLNNPAVNVRLPFPRKWGGDGDDDLIISLEHRSNGQTTDVTTPIGIERANRAYADAASSTDPLAQTNGRHFFDAISRGSNFLGAKAELTNAFDVPGLYLSSKLRWHFDEEFSVSWGPKRCDRRCIGNYDRLQFQAAYRWPNIGWLDAQWRVGDKGGATDSFTLGYQVISEAWPIYVRLHRGPMNTLSNYGQRQDSIGFGLRFARL
jgi:outer membrane phospholipase A